MDLVSESEIDFVFIVGCNNSGCIWIEVVVIFVKLLFVKVRVVIMWLLGFEIKMGEFEEFFV